MPMNDTKHLPPQGVRGLNAGEKYYREYWDGCWEFSYNKSHREHNKKDASVVREWYERYSKVPEGTLFDEDDLRLATGLQKDRHFHEWQAAVLLYENYGYLSLSEKYEVRLSHARKHDVLRNLAGEEFASFANKRKRILADGTEKNDYRQCPDLLVYKPDMSDWFFCEVKAGEGITPSQDSFFPVVKEKTGRPVYLFVLKPESLLSEVDTTTL